MVVRAKERSISRLLDWNDEIEFQAHSSFNNLGLIQTMLGDAKKEGASIKLVLNLSFLANISIILISMPSLPVSVRTKYGSAPIIPICNVLFSYEA